MTVLDFLPEKAREKGDTLPDSASYAEPPPYTPSPGAYGSTSQTVVPGPSSPTEKRQPSEDWTQPSFSRIPSFRTPPPPFTEEMHIIARSSLTQGFPMVSPPYSVGNGEPHPFATHDVTEQDWFRFLEDVRGSASLTEEQLRSTANMVSFIPVVNIIGCVVTRTVRQFMKAYRRRSVPITVENWNRHFFRPRKLEVVLTQGMWRLGDHGTRMPRALQHGCNHHRRDRHINDTWDGLTEKQLRRERRKERREVRREWRRERHGHGGCQRSGHESRIYHDGAYRLWVLPYTN